MRRFPLRSAGLLAAALFTLVALSTPAVTLAAEPTFGVPSMTTALGEPITITSTISGDDIASVDVVLHLAGHETSIVVAATEPQPGSWQAQPEIDVSTSALCACLADGHSAPNTRFDFHFRVHAADGSISEGPVGQGIVEDDRFTWQVLEQDQVRVHWYAGDQAFGQSAADVANGAIDKAQELLGVTMPDPVDLFVYDTEEAMRSAVSPNRENVAGEAHPDIQTMFVWIPSTESADSFAGVLIRHELTHLVFHEATDNDYHGVPRWLDEGTAVYLSEGYTAYWQRFVDGAVSRRSLIPLQGLAGLFPSVQDEFYLAYGESVASVDFYVRTYGEPKLWELVNSYSQGLSDDDAFTQATGADVEAFNRAWFESLGLEPQDPVGPQPGAPGSEPSEWSGNAPATIAPTPVPGTTAAPTQAPGQSSPGATPPPAKPDDGRATDLGAIVLGVGLVALIVIGAFAAVIVVQRNRAQRPPPGTPPPGSPFGPPPGPPPF